MKPLIDRIAVVAGATRGAGRGIACMLGEAGATVYCTGRSVAGHPPAGGAYAGRPETIEQTAAMVREHGGVGHAVRVDHGDATQVADLVAELDRVTRPRRYSRARLLGRRPAGAVRHAVLVDSNGRWPADDRAHAVAARDHPAGARAADAAGSDGRCGFPRLVVEVGDGPSLVYRTSFFFDLAAVLRARLAYAAAEELAPDGITVIGVSPGYLRSEASLDRFGVTERTWREAGTTDPAFLESETPFYLGRAIAAVAADPDSARWSGGLYGSWSLASAYGVRDVDGSTPDFGAYMARTYGESPGPLRTSARWTVGARDLSNDRAPVIKEGA